MNETIQLLQDVVRNARTGQNAIEQLLQRVDDPEMRKELMTEKEQYQAMVRDSEQALYDVGGKPEPMGMMAHAGMWMGMQINTLMDKTNAHIAEIVIQGATMGVIEMTKAFNAYEDADARARGLASNFITQQQDTIERQKAFLREEVAVKG